jgi:cell wall-associated NlpC family hydrolase
VWTGPAQGSPSIAELRSQVAQIEADVAAIDDQVEDAANAYNGAVYRLDQIRGRIEQNRRTLRKAERDLKTAQQALAERLLAAYRKPPPTRLQLILSSGSLSALEGGVATLDRISAQDGTIIRALKQLRTRTITARTALIRDRRRATEEVAVRAREREQVEGLLRRRQAVLAGAQGRLGRLLAEQRAREARRQAAAQRRALAAVRQAASRSATPATSTASPATVAPAASPSPPPASPNGGGSSANARAAQIALRYLGVPYVWGGASPSGFDCSGLASYAYAQVGVSVPHYTGAIWARFPKVTGSLQPGDMVFFRGLGHMGIYIGGGNMVHAPHTGDVVKITAMSSRGDYVGAVRP